MNRVKNGLKQVREIKKGGETVNEHQEESGAALSNYYSEKGTQQQS